ncbi:MAG TPA: 50S ribosomal protein L29 [Kiritimatiellia bacterium]|nr:50S ribosomal protein L29 [Kiritimatiellia bacterium]HRU71218.1 50S ribosomal protein L29 [Kiritimatiellia bacterium]
MKARDLRELGAVELEQRIREMSQELHDLRIKHKSGSGIEKPVRLRTMRREIARMKTVQAEREAK